MNTLYGIMLGALQCYAIVMCLLLIFLIYRHLQAMSRVKFYQKQGLRAIPGYNNPIIGSVYNLYQYFMKRKQATGKEIVRHILLFFIEQLDPMGQDSVKDPIIVNNNMTVLTLYVADPYVVKDLF